MGRDLDVGAGDTSLAAGGRGPISAAIFRVARAHKAVAGTLLADVGLHPGQEIVLMLLGANGPMEQRSLVRRLGTHPSTVTKMVQRLEQAGFVHRTPSTRDGRAMVVALTDRGSGLIERLHDIWEELERLTVAGLSSTQRKALLPSLVRLERSLEVALTDREAPPG